MPVRLSLFPLSGALLFPGLQLPLHIFEPRYRALVTDALARDRRIAMIQPRGAARGEAPALYDVGCVGRIAHVEALDDGRFNLVLEGVSRFRLIRELDVTTPFRQIEATLIEEPADVLSAVERADVERAARRYCERHGYLVDWTAISALDDAVFVNGIAQVAPFDAGAKQALLEADTVQQRAELAVQLLDFFGRHDGDNRVTLQ